MKASEFNGNLDQFLARYNYQPALTQKLDTIEAPDFTQHLINEIVLWKVDRYVALGKELLHELNGLKTLAVGEHRQGEEVLNELLKTRGVDLAMASTLLRFRNPSVFQIIDQHAYRAVYDTKYPLYSASPISRKVKLYFDYLDKLLTLTRMKELDFRTIDRILYKFDKDVNGKL